MVRQCPIRPVGEEPGEVAWSAVYPDVWVGEGGGGGAEGDADGETVGGVDAFAGGGEAGEVAVHAGIGLRGVVLAEGAGVEEGEVGGSFGDYGYFDVV